MCCALKGVFYYFTRVANLGIELDEAAGPA